MTTRKKTGKAPPASSPADVKPSGTARDSQGTAPVAGFPIVGIGASAGGLAAFEAFFSGMPADSEPGMAFVLVQHLAPDHRSLLSDLIARCTRMPVHEVDDGVVVLPNCVYIIPPNRDMAFLNGTLQLLEPAAPRGQRLPIDFFFRSLAQDQAQRAIGIVLSGTGSDGTQGIRAIKGEGGMVMAQDPETTEFDGMPRSAIATGLVDYTLPADEMPARLSAYAAHAFGHTRLPMAADTPQAESALKKIFVLLRAQTGHDFSQYKPSTINRRVERRMAVHQIDRLERYVRFLQQTPAEVEALFRDLLIGVTNFFRDPEAFKVLEDQVIPRLFEDKPEGSAIRIWCAGCSTGEEAYSIAMLLQERMDALRQVFPVQLFATDIDSRAVATARTGLYPANIAADISPERLARFFRPESDGSAYRVQKGLRDMLVFSEHDLIKDPPFSRLDLVTCRNLLIYLNASLQKKVIPLFHYALRPGGFMFLGTSEGVGEFSESFSVLDRKAKLYQRKESLRARERGSLAHIVPPLATMDPGPALKSGSPRPALPAKLPMRELTEQALLRQLAPTGALINDQGDIYYLHGRTGMYLEPMPGEPGISNILKMAREGLRRELTKALQQAAATRGIVRCPGLRVKTNGHYTLVNLTVCPVPAPAAPVAAAASLSHAGPCLYLAILEDVPEGEPLAHGQPSGRSEAPASTPSTEADDEQRIAELLHELRSKDEYLQSTLEELESSNEELKSSNEEMQSVNEELQSTNEEMETSKEELQSVNEELNTVNTELQTKITDLSRANNDMNNLLAGTGIGTVFVDHQLRILRFTPAASAITNLIQSDVGRPVNHIVSNMVGYDRLVADVREVLDTLAPKAVEVQTSNGKWHTMRILPYRTLDNVIEGAVISFIEITDAVHAREALHKANELLRLAVVVRDAHDAITVQDLSGRILAWNPGATRMYGWSEAEALAMNVRQRIPEPLRDAALATLRQLSQSEILEPYRTQRLDKQGKVMTVSIISTALLDASGEMYAIATTERTVGRPT
ncbi:MAG: PAS domain-containing protein [Arenimonas sp.]|uniref:chemotaxis protein CheB n=1 Tax=Arenimonas sp. TaxID=1872635 RepID=UPI0025BDEC3F|nr:chemotaxis protein CheB [Arenimonas sp.]MBW8368983.1 PAS domain-containing protein [Arenimonas sp.]